MNLNSINAFQDNYIWVLNDETNHCVIVDPGDANPVLEAIDRHDWEPEAIILTHHHNDHTGGVAELKQRFPGLAVYGPEETRSKGADMIVREGDKIQLLGHAFQVIATPGHTLGHICYFTNPYLFCGDTLFSGGCGRLFEGTAKQLFESFQKLNQLPKDTLICCAHEYTLSNLEFALSILPDDPLIGQYYREVKELRAKNEMSLPTLLKKELQINVFLRTQDNDLINVIKKETNLQQSESVFAWLRVRKDSF